MEDGGTLLASKNGDITGNLSNRTCHTSLVGLRHLQVAGQTAVVCWSAIDKYDRDAER